MKRLLALLLALAMILMAFAGCATTTPSDDGTQPAGTNSNEPASGETTSGAESAVDPVKFTFLRGVWGSATYTPDGAFYNWIKDKTGVEIECQIVPIAEYNDKVKTIVASTDLPDLMMADGPTSDYWSEVEDAGAFAPIEEYLEKYPVLKNLASDTVWEMLRNDDGHIYFLPRCILAEEPFTLMYRQDLFEEAGLSEPTTITELEDVLRAIKEKYPDMIPLTVGGANPQWMLKDLATCWNGAMLSGWKLDENGDLIPGHADEDAIDFVFWVQQMRDEGLIDYEVGLTNDDGYGNATFDAGKSVMHVCNGMQYVDRVTNIKRTDATAEVGICSPLVGIDGTQGGSASYFGMNKGYYVAATASDKIDAIMKYIAWSLQDEEATEFRLYGIEGENFYYDNDGTLRYVTDINPEYASTQREPLLIVDLPEESTNWRSVKIYFELNGIDEYWDYYYEKTSQWLEVKYPNYISPLTRSETDTAIGVELTQAYLASYWSVGIMTNSAITRSEYENALAAWKDAGGQQIIDEYNANQVDKSKPVY